MKSVKLNELLVVVFNHDELNSRNLYESFENLYNELDQHKLFIIDLSNIKYLNTEAIGSLLCLQNFLETQKKSLKMFQTKEQVKDVYHKLNLDSVMSMTNDTYENEPGNSIFYIN